MTNSPEIESTYLKARQELGVLLDLPNEEFTVASSEFVEARLKDLTSKSVPTRIDGIKGNYQGFINPETEIAPAFSGTGFKVDDTSIYDPFMGYMHHFYNSFLPRMEGDKQKAYRNAVVWAAQYAQQDYFGSVHNGADAFKKREELVWRGSFVTDEPEEHEVLSVSEFKEIAMCAERTAIANNMFQVAGINPVFVQGELNTGKKKHGELHAFLVMRNEDGQDYIYDPTNPHLIRNEAGSLVSTHPATYKVDESFLEATKSRAEATYKLYKKTDQALEVQEEITYEFSNNPFQSNFHPSL